jgi:hypothetical protein
VLRLDDARWTGAPEPIRARLVKLVPVLVEQIERLGGDGDGAGKPRGKL